MNTTLQIISEVPIRDFLLAKAFPARTRPLGSTLNNLQQWEGGNFNMPALFMTDPSHWIRSDEYAGWPEWRHSDIKDAPYVHIYKFFDRITGRTR